MLKFVYKVYSRADITLREMEQSFSKQAVLEKILCQSIINANTSRQ